jgi:hypothetical protein
MLTAVQAVKDVVLQMLTAILKAVKDAVYKGHKDNVLRTAADNRQPTQRLIHHSPPKSCVAPCKQSRMLWIFIQSFFLKNKYYGSAQMKSSLLFD